MTKSTITREERIQSLYDLKIGQVLNQSNIESIKILARIALAAMDSEPVAWRWRWSDDAEGYWRYTEEQRETRGSVTAQPLYRHALPAPVMPDFETVLKNLDYDVRCNIRESEHVYQASKATYDACHAAMLSVAQQEMEGR